jgi:ABC-type transport system involved in Fe-S cluster assembly fused permease/ATPase subunit
MNIIHESAMTIARSAGGNPITATLVVILFVLGIQMIEVIVERLIWGERFEHWLDVVILVASMAYAAYVVYACALHNSGR